MEVGAVKQAFNNEVIQLKRNLNQAKIQTIHKLTRKAKTFAEKKAPEKLKEKLKRKAESAVNEVLIIKKIKPRDVARFTATHTGNLQDYLNKPAVDQDKACARLLLHKSMQEKYKLIRNRFSSIPIKDLLMSRQERRKLKREAMLDKKMKKDKKQKVVNAEGEWDVENVKPGKIDIAKNQSKKFLEDELSEDNEDSNSNAEEGNSGAEDDNSDVEDGNSEAENDNSDAVGDNSDAVGGDNDVDLDEEDADSGSKDIGDEKIKSSDEDQSEEEIQMDETDAESDGSMETDLELGKNAAKEIKSDRNVGKFVKASPAKANIKETKSVSSVLTFEQLGKNRTKPEMKKPSKPKDVQKNKNLNEKLQTRKFKKESRESQVVDTKVVDPFFITSTGENYMSVAEPRQPDEIKEIHRQGNRKERRAAMFGYAPKVKPRQDFKQNKSGKYSDSSSGFRQNFDNDEGSFNNTSRGTGFRNGNDTQFRGKNDQYRSKNGRQFEDKNNQYKGRNDIPFEGRNDKFKGRNDFKFKGKSANAVEPKVEKLHPSWEAKKKQSGILPFQGKKIVFDES